MNLHESSRGYCRRSLPILLKLCCASPKNRRALRDHGPDVFGAGRGGAPPGAALPAGGGAGGGDAATPPEVLGRGLG